MRRLTGTYDGETFVIFEYHSGYVDCSPVLAALLANTDLSLPTGEELDDACLVLFGDSLHVQHEPAQGET
jgi:hypothetical protein